MSYTPLTWRCVFWRSRSNAYKIGHKTCRHRMRRLMCLMKPQPGSCARRMPILISILRWIKMSMYLVPIGRRCHVHRYFRINNAYAYDVCACVCVFVLADVHENDIMFWNLWSKIMLIALWVCVRVCAYARNLSSTFPLNPIHSGLASKNCFRVLSRHICE